MISLEIKLTKTANLKAGLTEEEAAAVEGAAQEAADEAAQPSEQAGGSASGGSASGATESAQPASGGSSDAGGPSSDGGSSDSGASEGGSSSGGSSEHVHSWTYHEALIWDKPVEVGTYIQCSCGAQFANQAAWSAHNQSLGFGVSHSYSSEPIYGYEQVCMQEAYYSCECGATMPA